MYKQEPIYLQRRIFHKLLLVLGLLLIGLVLRAQVSIQQVYDDGSFTIRNTSEEMLSVGDYWACDFPAYTRFSDIPIQCGSLELEPGAELTLSGFAGVFGTDDSELGIYTSQAFGSSDAIIAYVEWGPTEHRRATVAAEAGIWSDGANAPSFSAGESLIVSGDATVAANWLVESGSVVCEEPTAADPLEEARAIVSRAAEESGRTVEDFNGTTREFPEDYNNFLPSAISLDDLADPTRATAVLPLYEGTGPSGQPTYFIVTEATSIALAAEYGAIVSPKLRYGALPIAADAAQRVLVDEGRIIFRGDVDFSPERSLTAGEPFAFPPAAVQPGAVGDDEYSSLVVLPSGEVINAQIVANGTGIHDRIVEYNLEERWARFQLLDGWEGGDRFYYHLVTDASAPGPAAIELGVYAPRLANLPTFGNSEFSEETVLLGFSPNANGLTITNDDAGELNRQGLSSTIIDNDLDPVNVFPFDPDNSIEEGNNYSPMWDAHISMWTDAAINGPDGDQRRAITSFEDLQSLVDEGLVTSFAGSMGVENDFVAGLRATNAVINCPVICHPFQGEGRVARTPEDEARSLVELAAAEAGRPVADWTGSDRSFEDDDNVFLPSTIAVRDLEDPTKASATLPIYKGIGANGDTVYYIITEATTTELAEAYGAILSPKLRNGVRAEAQASAQRVDVVDGRMYFKGDVDFSPERVVEAGDGPFAFPPSVAQPGAVGDSAYSSLVVLPTGSVINAQIVANSTGVHDRINDINFTERWANFQLLDGWEGGRRFYYHLVTDASAPGPAAIELGVFAPRLANLPTFGNSAFDEESVLLGFSPNANGLTLDQVDSGPNDTDRQGLSSTIVDNDLDPVNVFPFDPDNSVEEGNNYSPMWDAHISMWTDAAINGPDGDQRRGITSLEDLTSLVDAGLVTSFAGSMGVENDFIAGLRATEAVINCPVIAHPFITTSVADSPVDCNCDFAASPNPAADVIRFTYDLPASGLVNVRLYDAFGRGVRQIVVNQQHPAGSGSVTWNRDGNLPGGTYYAVITVGGRTQALKLSLK